MNKFKRKIKMHRIMRLLNRFKRTDTVYGYLCNYRLTCEFYGTYEAENELLEIGYEKILYEIDNELFKKVDEIA